MEKKTRPQYHLYLNDIPPLIQYLSDPILFHQIFII